jgi:hypothetical protein
MFEQQNEILSRNGLRFFGMKSINSFPFEGTLRRFAGRRRRGDIGQWIDGDAVFLRDFMTWEELSNEQLLKLLLILAGCFSATSACSRLARILTQRGVLRPDAEHDLTMAFS